MRPLVPALLLALLLIAAPVAAPAQPLTAGGPDCGGDAFSSGQVVEHRPPRRGPLTAVPQTLCADLAPQRPPTQVDIYVNPYLGPALGGPAPPAPYGGGPPRPRYP